MIITPADLQPLTRTLELYPDVTLTIKRATLSDEGRRYQMLFAGDDLVNMIDIALVETWLTVESATITDPEDKPLIGAGMSFEQFRAGMTAIWGHDAALFWAIHAAVREANPRWAPQGNE